MVSNIAYPGMIPIDWHFEGLEPPREYYLLCNHGASEDFAGFCFCRKAPVRQEAICATCDLAISFDSGFQPHSTAILQHVLCKGFLDIFGSAFPLPFDHDNTAIPRNWSTTKIAQGQERTNEIRGAKALASHAPSKRVGWQERLVDCPGQYAAPEGSGWYASQLWEKGHGGCCAGPVWVIVILVLSSWRILPQMQKLLWKRSDTPGSLMRHDRTAWNITSGS